MSTDNTESLRAAIEAALRRRDPRATVRRYPTESDRSLWIARWPRSEITTRGDDGYFGLDGLRALAVACGLRVEACPACGGRGRRLYDRETEDGCDKCGCAGVVAVDPTEEVARLTRRLETAVPWEVSSPPTDEELRAEEEMVVIERRNG